MSCVADPLAGISFHFQRFTGAVCNADRKNVRYKQNVYSEFVFVYKLNSYMKAAWAITGAHTKLHAIVAALSIKLEQQQPFVRITLDCS